jgi:hypothetical protein
MMTVAVCHPLGEKVTEFSDTAGIMPEPTPYRATGVK